MFNKMSKNNLLLIESLEKHGKFFLEDLDSSTDVMSDFEDK
jgi:hypothetical protein